MVSESYGQDRTREGEKMLTYYSFKLAKTPAMSQASVRHNIHCTPRNDGVAESSERFGLRVVIINTTLHCIKTLC